MKKNKRLIIVCLALISTLILTACGKEKDYSSYIGQFEGNDPWGNKMSVTIRTVNDNTIDWAYGDVYNEKSENPIRVFKESISELTDGTTKFTIKGTTEEDGWTYEFDYTGEMTLKDGKIILKYENGLLKSNPPAGQIGGGAMFHVGSLDEDKKIVTLEKYTTTE